MLAVFNAMTGPICRLQRTPVNACEAGKCPEWQRELTVNQPPHGFEGSSPSFPTTLRPDGLRVAQPRNPSDSVPAPPFAKKRGGIAPAASRLCLAGPGAETPVA